MQHIPVLHHYMDRLLTQLVLALVAPTLLIGLLIGVPLAMSRRAALMAQEQLRATQMGEAAVLLFTERLRSGMQITKLLADQQLLTEQLEDGTISQLNNFLSESRTDTPFACLALIEPPGQIIAQSGDCELDFTFDESVVLRSIPEQGWIAQIRAPLRRDAQPAPWLVSMLPIGRGLIELAQGQPDLEISIVLDGQVIASSLPAHIDTVLTHAHQDSQSELHIGAETYLAHNVALPDLRGQPVAYAEVLLPLTRVRAAQMNVTIIVLAGMTTAMLLAGGLGWMMARRISQVIERLGSTAAMIGRGNLKHIVMTNGPAEIRHLSSAIDQMRIQLALSRELLESEKQRYLDILESIDEAVITLNINGEITSINQGAERMLHCTRDSVLGAPLTAIITMADGRALSVGTIPRHGPIRLAIHTAHKQALTISITCAEQPGKDGHILVFRDVSDNETINQLKDAFLANITHELRTPLAAQIASLEILRDEDESLTPDERRHMLEALYHGVQRLELLVQNLLDSASIEAGYFHVEPEPCRLEPLLDEAIELMQPLVRRRKQTIVLHPTVALPTVIADGRRMVQVLVNILANASKFGPVGDTIVITLARHDAGAMQIMVTDHGTGMPAVRRERLFERFLRPGTDTLQAQGAGLGLAIVKAIMDRHGGAVWVERETTQGTTIAIILPIFEEDAHENTFS